MKISEIESFDSFITTKNSDMLVIPPNQLRGVRYYYKNDEMHKMIIYSDRYNIYYLYDRIRNEDN